jgi:hypothetical protein
MDDDANYSADVDGTVVILFMFTGLCVGIIAMQILSKVCLCGHLPSACFVSSLLLLYDTIRYDQPRRVALLVTSDAHCLRYACIYSSLERPFHTL